MPLTHSASEASIVQDIWNVEKCAKELSSIIEENIKKDVLTKDTKALFLIFKGIIVLQMDIYRDLKKDLIKIGSKT